MTARTTHTFQFTAKDIAAAAKGEAEYHEDRLTHWQGRYDTAVAKVTDTVSAKVVQQQHTGGSSTAVVVDYGDPEAWKEAQLAEYKIKQHREEADRYRTDERVYGTQGDHTYELDTDDVHHFRLGGQPRED